MLVPISSESSEIIIKGSRFLAESFIISSQNQVREILKSQKQKYSDSTHVVHAFVAGKNGEIMGMSDDGEPSGTAGRPMLDVLKGRNCTNLLITVTRWFGGTLLGTGGLVHAYGDCTKSVLEIRVGDERTKKTPTSAYIDYLKTPKVINLTDDDLENDNDLTAELEFPEYACFEIINEFVKLLLENASDPRLQTNIPINQSIGSAQ